MTVAFYRDILKLEGEEKAIDNLTVSKTHQVKFGNNVMWLDCVDNYTHSETWLELNVSNVDTATKYLNSKGVEILMLTGGFLLVAGIIVFFLGDRLKGFGSLPGDIRIEKPGFGFYMPLTSMLLVSVALSLLVWLINKFF